MDGKPQPIIRHIIDDEMGMCKGCFCTCFQVYKSFEWDPESYQKAMAILKNSRQGRMGQQDKYGADAQKPTRYVGFDKDEKKAKNSMPRGAGFGFLNPSVKK